MGDQAANAGLTSSELVGYGGKLEGLRMTYRVVHPGGMAPATFVVRVMSE